MLFNSPTTLIIVERRAYLQSRDRTVGAGPTRVSSNPSTLTAYLTFAESFGGLSHALSNAGGVLKSADEDVHHGACSDFRIAKVVSSKVGQHMCQHPIRVRVIGVIRVIRDIMVIRVIRVLRLIRLVILGLE
jgi:hypothetical protein